MTWVVDRFRASSFEARAAMVAVVAIGALMWFVIIVISPLEQERLRQERLQFEEDVVAGRKLRTGEPVITDEKTGCKYIKTIFKIGNQGDIGHTLTPRIDDDGRPMGCKRK